MNSKPKAQKNLRDGLLIKRILIVDVSPYIERYPIQANFSSS